jgi:hypothetical protein
MSASSPSAPRQAAQPAAMALTLILHQPATLIPHELATLIPYQPARLSIHFYTIRFTKLNYTV